MGKDIIQKKLDKLRQNGSAQIQKVKGWESHGSLMVSSDGHYLQYGDGTPFFWLGDTVWKLPSLAPYQVEHYLKNRHDKKFTVIQLNLTNQGDSNFENELPFLGNGPPWAKVELNEKYWNHVDSIIDRISEYGMHAVLFTMWGTNAGAPKGRFFSDPAEHNYQFGNLVGLRYKEKPNVVWCVTGEYDSIGIDNESFTEEGLHYLRKLAQGISEAVEGNQLITYHPWGERTSSAHWHNEKWLSFNMIQSFGHMKASSTMVLADYNKNPTKPVLNAEPGYEDRHLYRPDKGVIDAWHLRMEAYISLFSGAFGYTYGHVTVWHLGTEAHLGKNWKRSLNRPGARQMQHVRALLESIPYKDKEPDSSLITSDHQSLIYCCRSVDSSWALVYSSMGEGFTFNMPMLRGESVYAKWYDPRKGFFNQIGVMPYKKEFEFIPPGGPKKGNDWVLVLDTVRRR